MGQKKRKKQAELIQELTDQELVWNVVASQLIFYFWRPLLVFFYFLGMNYLDYLIFNGWRFFFTGLFPEPLW